MTTAIQMTVENATVLAPKTSTLGLLEISKRANVKLATIADGTPDYQRVAGILQVISRELSRRPAFFVGMTVDGYAYFVNGL